MKPRTKTLIKLTVLAIFVVVALVFVRMVQYLSDYRDQLRSNSHLGEAWWVVVHNQDDEKLIPPAVTIFEDSGGKKFQHSWRLVASVEASQSLLGLEWTETHRFDESWNSPNNLKVAEKAAENFGTNYFGTTFGGVDDASPSHARILVVTGEGGAWLKDGTQTKKELMAKGDKIAMVYLPDSKIKLFEPKDITFQELVQLVNEKGKVHAYTAQGKLRVLDEEWANEAEQDLMPHDSQ